MINRTLKIHIASVLALLGAMMFMQPLYANPEGGVVSAGSATITPLSATKLLVTQGSDRAVIDWRTFNIGNGETTQFNQPSASAAILNRVNAAYGGSTINGNLIANGQVFIVNPAGIVFGQNARVDVAAIVASTANISNQNFMNGIHKFEIPRDANGAEIPQGAIVNYGEIKAADHGLVALLGPSVQNHGRIQARLGNVVLASGKAFTLDFYGDQLINFKIDAPSDKPVLDATGKAINGVTNTGTIMADGGRILVSAHVAKGIVDNVINMQGVAQARGVEQRRGKIILAGYGGKVKVSGKLDVSGYRMGQRGGKIKIVGDDVHVTATAKIKANGNAGGGTILIGGDYQGKNIVVNKVSLANAKTTIIDAGATINANAINSGNGGKVIVWADDSTYFHGAISARGGLQSGDGGFVETSGHYLDIAGSIVNTLAPFGKTGTWLLDPADISIQNNGGFNSKATLNGGTYSPDSDSANSVIDIASLQTALASSNIIVTTTNNGAPGAAIGNITLVDPLSWSANTLTLLAANQIIINATVSGANLILTAGSNIAINANINLSGNFTANSATTISNANITTGGFQIYNNPVVASTATTLTGNNINFISGASGAINIIGSGANPTLTYATGGNTWRITNNSSGTVASLSFSNISQVNAGVGDSLSNTLGNSTWNIAGNNVVSVAGINFTNISGNLTGGSNDTFAFVNNGSLSGSIMGGGNNTLSYINYAGQAQVTLNTESSGTATGINGGFSGFSNLLGSSGLNVTLSVAPGVSALFNKPGSTTGTVTINGVGFAFTNVNTPPAPLIIKDTLIPSNLNVTNAAVTAVGQTSAIGATGFSSTNSGLMGGSTQAEQNLLAVQAATTAVNNATTAIQNSQDSQDIQQHDKQQFSNCS